MVINNKNAAFVRSLGWALLALAASALVLCVIFITYAATQAPTGSNVSPDRIISGTQLKTIMGTTRIKADTLAITALEPYQDSQRGLVVLRTTFNASSYPFLRYQIAGQQPGVQIYLIWRTAENPTAMSSARLHWNIGQPSTINLGNHADWQDTIVELGVDVIGDLRDQPLILSQLALKPWSGQTIMTSVWSEWTAFRGWTGRSINHLQGTPGIATLSPTLAIAAWSGLALIFIFALGAIRGGHKITCYGTAIVIPWVALDLLWQSELTRQLEETQYLFSGKTSHEKHLVDLDRHIYAYTLRLKDEALPSSAARLFILHDSDDLNYERLKAQYYLLPHNIYNYGRTPPTAAVRPGDYILVLGEVPGLRFRPERGRLIWKESKGRNKLRVTLADSDPLGKLYKVSSQTTESPAPGRQRRQDNSNG